MLKKYTCAQTVECKHTASFFVSICVYPQILDDDTVETVPAARIIITCGNHLPSAVRQLGSLEIRTTDSVRIHLI